MARVTETLSQFSLFLVPRRIMGAAVIIRPSSLLRFHVALQGRKYRLLLWPSTKAKPSLTHLSVEGRYGLRRTLNLTPGSVATPRDEPYSSSCLARQQV